MPTKKANAPLVPHNSLGIPKLLGKIPHNQWLCDSMEASVVTAVPSQPVRSFPLKIEVKQGSVSGFE